MPHMELTLPAGSLVTAAHALRNGADAVYLGMQSFSARAAAKNLSFEELMRIRGLADSLDKRLYVTLNTLVTEAELPQAMRMVEEIACARADGIIVQDLGVASLIRREFPQLPLHGSTQIAVQTSGGVRALQDLGFSRVVLARELTLDEIASIRTACPDISLKVFIHGALCYGMSGLCLASGLALGSSANRGLCRQICRTWSTIEEDGEEAAAGWWFSMKDLAMKQDILALRDIGVDALKVEGRMKSPEYVTAVAAYYRTLLDGKEPGEKEGMVDLTFARKTTTGWAGQEAKRTGRPAPLTSPDYSRHRGILIGKVLSTSGAQETFVIESDRMLSPRDGIMILTEDTAHSGLMEGHSLGVKDPVLLRSHAGRYELRLTNKTKDQHLVGIGAAVYLTSLHDQTLPDINPASLPQWKFPIDIHIDIFSSRIRFEGTIPCMLGNQCITLELPCEPLEAEHPSDIADILTKVFSRTGSDLWAAGKVTCDVDCGIPSDRVFVRPSQVKQLRRAWYDHLAAVWAERPLWSREPHRIVEDQPIPACSRIPRSAMTERIGTTLPFITRPQLASPEPVSDDYIVLPLSPLQFEGSDHLDQIEQLIVRLHQNYPAHTVMVGLQHIAHLHWAGEARKRLQATGPVRFFGDLYLYASNHEAIDTYSTLSGGLDWVYQWIEQPESIKAGSSLQDGVPVVARDPDFLPPIFVSRSCFVRDSLRADSAPEGERTCAACTTRSHEFLTHQKTVSYRIVVEDCTTYVFQIPRSER